MKNQTKPEPFLVDAMAPNLDWARPSPRGKIVSVCDERSSPIPYYLYLPRNKRLDRQLVVSVHGWTRNSSEHIFRLSEYAEKKGVALFVPHFSKERHRHYQRLETKTGQVCVTTELHLALADVSKRFGVPTTRFNLFGFSGGAQFAHRYALMYPDRIARLALMSAGWFTMPDKNTPYPFGLAPSVSLSGRALELEGLLACPTRVFVGTHDIHRDASLNKDERIDLVQGRNRVERAGRWVAAMNGISSPASELGRIQLCLIEGASHSFSDVVRKHNAGQIIFDWLIPPHQGDHT